MARQQKSKMCTAYEAERTTQRHVVSIPQRCIKVRLVVSAPDLYVSTHANSLSANDRLTQTRLQVPKTITSYEMPIPKANGCIHYRCIILDNPLYNFKVRQCDLKSLYHSKNGTTT